MIYGLKIFSYNNDILVVIVVLCFEIILHNKSLCTFG